MGTVQSMQDFKVKDWVVRPQRLCLERGEEIVHIKPKSMAVLVCLATAKGEVVTRSRLFEEVWPGAQVSDDVLTQSVVELRRAFGDSARNANFIETIPRRGFRLLPAVSSAPESTEAIPEIQTAGVASVYRRKRFIRYAALGFGGLVVIAVLVWLTVPVSRNPILTVEDSPTLVVLPFADMSSKGDQQYFADGLAEEVRDGLARLDGLQVIGRTSAFSFRDKDMSLREIASVLDVGHVLEGSVRRSSQRMRVNAQLLDAVNGIVLWSDQYDRDLQDLFAVQDEIARSVATALSIKLGVGNIRGLAGETASVEAHNEVLKGQALYRQYTPDAVLDAIEHFKNAAEIDPNYPKAWERLVDIYCTSRHILNPAQLGGDWRVLSGEALQQAMRLAPDSPELLGTTAFRQIHLGEWMEARETLKEREKLLQGSQQHPANVDNVTLLILMGKPNAAVAVLERERRLDPRSGIISFYLANTYVQAQQLEAALQELERGYELGDFRSLMVLSGWKIALLLDDREAMEKWLDRAWEFYPERKSAVEKMVELIDSPDEAVAWLRNHGRDSKLSTAWAVIWSAYHGDGELAVELLNDVETVSWEYWNPLLADARQLQAFKQLVTERGMVDYWRRFGWGEFCRPLGETDFECF